MYKEDEDINLAVESLPNPSEGHILHGILLQEAIEANEWHHIHDRHCQIITLISYVYTICYLRYAVVAQWSERCALKARDCQF